APGLGVACILAKIAVAVGPFVAAVPWAFGAEAAPPANPAVDMGGYLRVANAAAMHRGSHRLSEAEFIRMSKEAETVILDARGGVSPVVTPVDAQLRPEHERFVTHCRWLDHQGVGLAVFGTNPEANSMSVAEKIALLDTLIHGGLPAARMMPGTGCCALTDSVALTRHAVARGCAGVLMLPPFYYKSVSTDGLFRSYAEVIERVGESDLRV